MHFQLICCACCSFDCPTSLTLLLHNPIVICCHQNGRPQAVVCVCVSLGRRSPGMKIKKSLPTLARCAADFDLFRALSFAARLPLDTFVSVLRPCCMPHTHTQQSAAAWQTSCLCYCCLRLKLTAFISLHFYAPHCGRHCQRIVWAPQSTSLLPSLLTLPSTSVVSVRE